VQSANRLLQDHFVVEAEFHRAVLDVSQLSAVDAVALEDSQICVIPYADLETLSLQINSLQQQFHRIMSREIVRNHSVMLLLGSMHAEERLAAFLLNLTHRLQTRGFSSSSVVLRMSREEIGSFLGLKLETVSRTFSKFQADGLLFVRHRQIQITDPVGLQQLIDGGAEND
jgi:CRP/FNR family transcriptional regulator